MKTFLFWQRWLFATSLFIIAFGVMMALMNGTALFAPFDQGINPVFWDGQEPSAAAVAFQGWVYGVWGATVAGWGVFLACMAWYPFKARQVWSRNCFAGGLALWYVLDTGISLAYGVYFNAFFNTLLLVLAVLPLGFSWHAFGRGGE